MMWQQQMPQQKDLRWLALTHREALLPLARRQISLQQVMHHDDVAAQGWQREM